MVMQMGATQGMRLMDDSLEELVRGGTIALEDAFARAQDRKRFAGVPRPE
jgi:Tfp pilus assembly pilus retraction ATPase PilT